MAAKEAALRYKGRILSTTAARPFRTRYESIDEAVPLDFEKPPAENFRRIFSVALDSPKNYEFLEKSENLAESSCDRNSRTKSHPGSFNRGTGLAVRIAHLNNLIKLLVRLKDDTDTAETGTPGDRKNSWGFSKLELLNGLRCLLTDEDKDVRAGSLRCLRYLIETVEDLYLALQLHLDILIARSLDLVLDNRVERVQSLRLISHLLNIYCAHRTRHELAFKPKNANLPPSCRDPVLPDSKFSFPNTLLRPLIALSLDGLESDTGSSIGFSGQDKLCRAATAQLLEMAVKCPFMVLNCAGTGWVVRALLGSICSQPRLGEVVVAVAMRWVDSPRSRARRDVQLLMQELIAPLTDPHYQLIGGNPEKEEGRVRLQIPSESEYLLNHCKVALRSVLRTWPGIVAGFSDPSVRSSGLRYSPLETLVDSLAILQCERTREVILELFCELLHLPYSDEHFESWIGALGYVESRVGSSEPFKCSISQGFVCAEAGDLLPNLASVAGRPNLIGQFQAVTLFAMVQSGLTKALGRVILLNPDHPISIKATLLLHFVLQKAGKILPAHWRLIALSTPTLIQAFCDRNAADTVCPSVATSESRHRSSGLNQDTKRDRAGSDTMKSPLPPGRFRKVLKEYAHLLCDRLHDISTRIAKPKTPHSFILERLIQRSSALHSWCNSDHLINSKSSNISISNQDLSGGRSRVGSTDSLFGPQSPKTANIFRSNFLTFGRSSQQNLTENTALLGAGAAARTFGFSACPVDHGLHDKIKDSRAAQPYTNPMTGWDWELVDMALAQLSEVLNHMEEDRPLLKHLDDSTCGKFLNNLIQFYWPQHGQFGKLSEGWKSYARSGCHAMQVGARFPRDSLVWGSLRNFVTDLNGNLVQDRLFTGFLSTKHLLSSATIEYFTFIGELSASEQGCNLLERTGTLQRLLDVLNEDSDLIYVKLIVTCLDYSKPSTTRTVLQKALTSTKEAGRLYATEYLRILARLKVEAFEEWGVEMACIQLNDRSHRVVTNAVNVLEEILWNPRNMGAFSRIRAMVLLNLGSAGTLLRSHWFFAPSNTQTELEENLWTNEIALWQNEFNLDYVDVVEEKMREANTQFERSADGSYPRHSNETTTVTDLPVPSHLYGQLARHLAGCQLMLSASCVSPLLDTVQYGALDSELEIREMKAAIWALGNIGTSDLGCMQLLPMFTVPCLVKMAEECPVLSVRGVALWSLNLIGQSTFGAQRLTELGWECSLESGIIPAGKNWKFRSRRMTAEFVESETRTKTGEKWSGVEHCEHREHHHSTSALEASAEVFGLGVEEQLPRNLRDQMTRRPRSMALTGSGSSVTTCESCEICHAKLPSSTKKLLEPRRIDSDRSREPSFSENVTIFAEMDLPKSPELLPYELTPIFVSCCDEIGGSQTDIGRNFESMTTGDENVLNNGNRSGRSRSFGAQETTPESAEIGAVKGMTEESGRRNSFSVEAEESVDEFPERLPRPLPKPKKIDEKCYLSTPPLGSFSSRTGSFSDSLTSAECRKPTSTLAVREDNTNILHSRSKSFGGITPIKVGTGDNPKTRHAATVSGSEQATAAVNERKVTGFSVFVNSSALTSGIGSLDSRLANTPLPSPGSNQNLNEAIKKLEITPSPFGAIYQDYFFERHKTERNKVAVSKSPTLELEHKSADLRRAMSFKAIPKIRTVLPRLLNEVVVGDFGRKKGSVRPQFMQEGDAVGYEILQNLENARDANSSDEEKLSSRNRLEESYSEIASGYEAAWDELKTVDQELAGEREVVYCLPVDMAVLATNVMQYNPSGMTSTGVGTEELGTRNRPRTRSYRQRDPTEIQGIKTHLMDHCLHCSGLGRGLKQADSESGFIDSTLSSETRSRTDTQASQVSAISADSGASESGYSDSSNRILVRKEILRLICQLTVRPKYAEKGLLRLRQECPGLFSTVCLYCDIMCVITGYQFKLPSRRFIQELFQDVDFSELAEEPLKVFGKPDTRNEYDRSNGGSGKLKVL